MRQRPLCGDYVSCTLLCIVKAIPPETEEIAGGKEAIARELDELGPMKRNEKMLLGLSLVLLFLWATEKILHPFDSSTTTIAAITIMLLPGVGVMTWKEAQARIPWGTLVLFGVGISLGSVLLSTKAAPWLAKVIVGVVWSANCAGVGRACSAGRVFDCDSPGLCQCHRTGGSDADSGL